MCCALLVPRTTSSAMALKRVGVCWDRSVTKNLNFEDPEVLEVYRSEGLELVKVDLMQPLQDQGAFDVIIQKIVDVFLDSKEDRTRAIQNMQDYTARHPTCLLLNPTANTEMLNDRMRLFPIMKKALENESDFFTPAFVELNTTDVGERCKALSNAGVAFPIVCKPVVGTDHMITVVFNEAGLGDMPAHCVAQTFVNHGATLYKTYMLGDTYWHVARKSVADLHAASDTPSVVFHSPSIANLDEGHILRGKNELRPLPEEDAGKLGDMGRRLRSAVGMDLFGIDFIYDVTTDRYAVIDINDFPAYTGVKDFHQCMARYIWDKLDPEGKCRKA